MERIYQIKFSRIDTTEFHPIFNISGNIPNLIEKYYVLSPRLISLPTGFGVTTEGYGVYDSDHQLLGDIRIDEFSNCTIVSFYLEDEKHKQALMEFIESSLDDMKFVGLPIILIRDFSSNSVEKLIEDKPYTPQSKAKLEKWKKAYREICEYKKELSESYDSDTFVPNVEDFQVRLRNIQIEYTTKTIRRIIKAGDYGLLK